MNKKFSTLVASVLLAGSLGANAQIISDLELTQDPKRDPVAAYSETDKLGGYQVGMSYVLKSGDYDLAIKDGKLSLAYYQDVKSNFALAQASLWTLQQIVSPEGAVAPKYVFMNNATNQILAVNPNAAVKIENISKASTVAIGGSQTEWLNAPSYKNPAGDNGDEDYPIYAALQGDSIIALAKQNPTTGTTPNVVLVKTSRSKLSKDEILTFVPHVYTRGYYLTAKDLNTMLGAAGNVATADSYFSFNFDPEATVQGEDNLWTQDLQAVAVDQYEVKYGTEAKDGGSVIRADYASLYPLREQASASASAVKTIQDSKLVSFDNTEAQYLAFKNRDNQYLVVDTLSIDGTSQKANLRMSFTMDGLFNAKNSTRFRNPKSYLFSVLYNPSTKNITIQTMDYFDTPKGEDDADAADFVPADYYKTYENAATKEAARWTVGGTSASLSLGAGKTIIKAALGKTTEVTVGNTQDTPNNQFAIKLGVSSKLQTTHIASGAYLIKVYASDNADRVGKYWVNNLKGGFEIMEQAVRQNFQDMPAAQWIVSSTGTIDGSPVTIVNREFEGQPSSVTASGILYRESTYPANVALFSVGQDVLQFIPVEKPNDKYLGYKFISDKDIDVTTFTFNYLHDLAMDKPVNTKSDKDSVVWVDKDGNGTKFILEKYMDDTYGTNGKISGVAELTRRVYKIKVNDASKLENDGRYLAYDAAQKKYKVSENGDLFFLKENNEVESGSCYYALVRANVIKAGKLEVKLTENGYVDEIKTTTLKSADKYVEDDDIFGMFYAGDNKVKNPNTGLYEDGLVPTWWSVSKERVDGKAYIPMTEAQYKEIYRVEKLPDGNVTKGSTGAITVADGEKTYNDWLEYTDSEGHKYVVCFHRWVYDNSSYADYKVSVDNNTLDLVNGVLSNYSYNEVATSAFAVAPIEDPLYRRFNVEALGENADDAPNTLKFFRVNATDKEYLYEDAQSVYSKDKGFNFLGVEGKGDAKNAAIYVDTAYVDRGTKMPQYLLALRPNIVKGDTILCDATTHAHATVEEALACDHSKVTPSYVDAWYLVNLQDSIDYYDDAKHKDAALMAKYQWNRQYTRLGFVEARHIGDTLVIKNSVYTGDTTPIKVGDSTTVASKDSIFLDNNLHKNVVFSFRIAKSGSNDFLIESETEKNGSYKKNADLDAVKIAPMNGGWVKIQNGVPVIANVTYQEAGTDAEIFNVEATDEAPTANDAIATSEVSIVAVQGAVVVKNAAGKKVAISNILGQNIANAVLSSDNETIAVPAGIVVVAVEGEEAVKAVVK